MNKVPLPDTSVEPPKTVTVSEGAQPVQPSRIQSKPSLMKRFEIMMRFDAEDYPAAIKRVAKLLKENPDWSGTGIQGADHLTFEPVATKSWAEIAEEGKQEYMEYGAKRTVGIDFPNPKGYPVLNPTPDRS